MTLRVTPPYSPEEHMSNLIMCLALIVALMLLASWVEGQAKQSAQQWRAHRQERTSHGQR